MLREAWRHDLDFSNPSAAANFSPGLFVFSPGLFVNDGKPASLARVYFGGKLQRDPTSSPRLAIGSP